MRRRFLRPGIETTPTSSGIARFKYSTPIFREQDTVDLTLPIGSHGEHITIRRLHVAGIRRSRYSGRVEYKLHDSAQNRIDYTRWFEESSLSEYDPSVPDPVCKRVTKRGQQCASTPTFPSGLCIKHKAKLDWDREKIRRKLEVELKERSSTDEDLSGRRDHAASAPSQSDSAPRGSSHLGQSTTLLANASQHVAIQQIAMSMWGDVELFTTATSSCGVAADPDTHASSEGRWRTCIILILLCAATILFSLTIALWWTLTHHSDVSGGFTMGGYIVAVSGLPLYVIQNRHSKDCRCWRRSPKRAQTM
ncbi:hypothetical protein LTR37_017908 [Vermiconidia calcicola]|uniref:Uncharacterized protein n=1 Tax=Vermiconidia calcicola TaxID=1690605 RepID=A0ACC3MJL0_9PEZI|nr:hypothetical protein LTR37_017908 [Vermiconidia calcicola]